MIRSDESRVLSNGAGKLSRKAAECNSAVGGERVDAVIFAHSDKNVL